MTNILWHYNDGFWDCALPHYIFSRIGNCEHYEGLGMAKKLYPSGPGVIVIPGRHSTNDYDQLNKAAENFRRIVFVIIGDEEGVFDSSKLVHGNKKIWWFMPPYFPPQKVDRVGPNGWPTGAPDMIRVARKIYGPERTYDFSFAGQVTHERREACVRAAHKIHANKFIFPTAGFTQGLPRDGYYNIMVGSKFVLCPSGPCTPDSFRFAEALEAGCVPIVDGMPPKPGYNEGYWYYAFDDQELPFPVISDWDDLPGMFPTLLEDFERLQKRCTTWWAMQKDLYVLRMQEDLAP